MDKRSLHTNKFLFLILLLLTGCSSAISQRGDYLAPFHSGQIQLAEANISRTVEKAVPNDDYRNAPDATWLLLDRATIRFAGGDVEGAIEDYHLAIEALDYDQEACLEEMAGKLLLQDELGAYAGEDYEQVLARVYFALALLHQGDLSNAQAILRQAEELQQKKREMYRGSLITQDYELIDNPVAKYLFALLLEKEGDTSNATILYNQATQLAYIQSCEDLITHNPQMATVLVVCHNGNAPIKISGISDASIASTVALECFLQGSCHSFTLSSLGGISTPILQYPPMGCPLPTFVEIEGQTKRLIPWMNIGDTAEQQLSQEMPVIVARGVARYLMRRAALASITNRDPNLGAFTDIALLVANLNTKADTRSWTTLPEFIDLNRFEICPGIQPITIRVNTPYGISQQYDYTLDLRADELCIIHVFNIHPGITKIQIPPRFLIKQGEPS